MGREAGGMGERLSAQVFPKGLDVLSSDLRRWRRARGQKGREVRGARIISATNVSEELGKGRGEQQRPRP